MRLGRVSRGDWVPSTNSGLGELGQSFVIRLVIRL